ncbi:MAG: POTRA domain-containing protein, partial [Thermomonas sp.]
MTPPPMRLLFALACCLATAPAIAAKVTKVDVTGLPDEVMEDNVRSALSLSDELDKDITERRLNYLLRQAEAETREALEPFGYYSPVITVKRSDRERAVGEPAPRRDPES